MEKVCFCSLEILYLCVFLSNSVKFQKSVRLAKQSFGHLFVWIYNLIDLIAESKSPNQSLSSKFSTIIEEREREH